MASSVVQREKITEGAVNLLDPHKNVLNFLADCSRLFGIEKDEHNKKFTNWVKKIYDELINNPLAEIIMKILKCSLKVDIIYMPDHENVFDIEKTGNCEYILEGVTYARVEQIIIAAKDYENEEHRDRLKGLIIHEFCHFAVYETFCNGFDAFYLDDEIHKTHWIAAMEECEENKNMEKIIDEVFGYPERKWLQELVVRYFQYQVQYQSDKLKLNEFKKNFPKLCAVCEDYVMENLKVEHKKIRAIREINQSVTMSEDSSYKIDAIRCDVNFNPSHNTQIIKSNSTELMANYIFYEFEKMQNFKGKFVFLDAKYLHDNLENVKLAIQRRAKCTFVIDCDYENFAAIESDFKEEIEKIATSKNIIVLLGKHQHFKVKTGLEYVCNCVPSHLTDEFINDLKINFQGQDMLLTELITVDMFQKLTSLPMEKMHKERISIGNQMELQLITEYVERKFLIKNQNNDKWEKLDDSETIITKHKRILVANEPGAGKTIESIKMYYRLKEKYPKDWIIHINLSRLVEVFEEEKEKFHTYSQSEKFKILFCHSILKLNEFEYDLFEFLLKSGRVVLIFDSLDEISPFYFSIVSSLTQMIIQKFSEQRLIIFTRPHLVIEMEEFEFVVVKIDEIEENARNDLISNILKKKCARKSEETKNDIKESVLSFLQKRNFHTPLLIRMVTEVASLQKLNSDDMTLYYIYKSFFNKFDQIQEDKNENITTEKMNLRDIEKYFQKCAIEKLFENQQSGIDFFNNGRIEICKEDSISFKDDFFNSLKVPDIEKMQRKGITIHSKSNPEFDFIHASFNDFYIADFIVSEIKSLVKSYKSSLIEIFSMLIQENRLSNVIEFLKGHDEVAKYLKEFDVIFQMIDDTKVEDGVNIMPVIKFIADSIARSPIIRNICRKNKLYSSIILLTDPIRTLEKICSFKAPKYFVYEKVLMNRTDHYNLYEKDDHPINILDLLAQCGTEDSFGFYVSKHVFGEYFNKLTMDNFKIGQIASMMDVLKKSYNTFNRSFFLMAKIKNKIIIETFLNFFEKLLEKDDYFADTQFSCFISILILNNESDHEKLRKLTEKFADLNSKSVRELFSCSKLNLGVKWGDTIRENIKHFRDKTSPEQFEKAINFYFDIFDNKPDGSHSEQQARFWFRFILTILDEQLFDIFKIAVNRLTDKCENANAMLRDILMRRGYKDMTILQDVFCLNTTEKDQITDFTFNCYERIFGCDSVEICNLFLEPEFFIKLFLAENDNTRIISSILQCLKKAENNTSSWLELMISYSNCFGTDLIDSLLNTKVTYRSVLRDFSFTDKHPELPKLMKEILQQCINSQNYSEVIYEIFSNETLTKGELADILDALFFKDDMLERQIDQILSHMNPEDGSTIIIAASKCEHEGRIEILMKLLENYSDTELFKSCLLASDNESKPALFYLLRNKHQQNYFQTLFDKVEFCRGDDRNETDRIRDLIYRKDIKESECRYKNVFYETLITKEDDISEEKYVILEKLFKFLSKDKQKKLIFSAYGHHYSLFGKIIKKSFDMSKRVLKLTLQTLFENETLHRKVLQKLKRFSGYKGNFLVSAEMFSSAFNYYKLKSSDKVIDILHRIFNVSYLSYSHNLSIGNFQFFRKNRIVIHNLISKMQNNEYSDYYEKLLMITFLFMLDCDDYVPLLESASKNIQNYNQSKNLKFLFSLIKTIKLNIEELEVFFEKNDDNSIKSPFCLYLTEKSYRFLPEFLDFIESMCMNKAEFRKFLELQLSQLKNGWGNNVFHQILSNSRNYSDFDSTVYFEIYETLKTKLGNSNLLNKLHRQTNHFGDTPIMLALEYTNIEKCLKFFSENLLETSMGDLLQINNSMNDVSHLIFENLSLTDETSHNDFESIIKPLSCYFTELEVNEMFENACTKKYPGNRNFIHVLFECNSERNSITVSMKYLSLLFDEMKKRFSVDKLTELILEEDEYKDTPLEVTGDFESFVPYFKLIEKHFDGKAIRTLLSKNEGTEDSILHKALSSKFEEDKLFTVQFYKKFFSKEEFENMLRKVFETSDCLEIIFKMVESHGISILLSQLRSYFGIISDNIHNSEFFIKTFFSHVNKRASAILAIDNFKDLIVFVQAVKLTEFYFSRDVVKTIFKIVDSKKFVWLFIKAKNYERCEMIDLLKEYYPGELTKILVNSQVQSMKINERFYVNYYRGIKIIDLESKDYGYAIYELFCILVNKLSNSERRIEQENNFQGYAIVFHEYRDDDDNRKFLLCLQAIFSIPRESLTNARINGQIIEWEYDEGKNRLEILSKNFTFSTISLSSFMFNFLGMKFKTCIAIKSNDPKITVLAPMGCVVSSRIECNVNVNYISVLYTKQFMYYIDRVNTVNTRSTGRQEIVN